MLWQIYIFELDTEQGYSRFKFLWKTESSSTHFKDVAMTEINVKEHSFWLSCSVRFRPRDSTCTSACKLKILHVQDQCSMLQEMWNLKGVQNSWFLVCRKSFCHVYYYFTFSLSAYMHIVQVQATKDTCTSKNLHALMHVCTWVNCALLSW